MGKTNSKTQHNIRSDITCKSQMMTDIDSAVENYFWKIRRGCFWRNDVILKMK